MFEINGKKYFKVFDLSMMNRSNDPDGIMSEEFLSKAALNYDPVNVHEAVFWSDHPLPWSPEPRTGGYIDSVLAIGKEFYVSFSEILPWMKELYDTKEYKRCSAEFVILSHQEKKLEYFYAMCPTNMPGVRGLPPLDSAHFKNNKHAFIEGDQIEKRVSLINNFELNFQNKNSTIMQNAQLVALAKKNNITVTESMSDTEIQTALEAKFTEISTAKADADKNLALEKKNKAIELVDAAIASGQLKPSDNEGDNFAKRKEAIIAFAEADYDAAKIMLSGMPSDPSGSLLGKSGLESSKVDLKNAGGKSSDANGVTFDDVIGDPEKYMGKFTDDQLEKMHKEDPRWKNAGLATEKSKI